MQVMKAAMKSRESRTTSTLNAVENIYNSSMRAHEDCDSRAR
jgi:hypothetical protein